MRDPPLQEVRLAPPALRLSKRTIDRHDMIYIRKPWSRLCRLQKRTAIRRPIRLRPFRNPRKNHSISGFVCLLLVWLCSLSMLKRAPAYDRRLRGHKLCWFFLQRARPVPALQHRFRTEPLVFRSSAPIFPKFELAERSAWPLRSQNSPRASWTREAAGRRPQASGPRTPANDKRLIEPSHPSDSSPSNGYSDTNRREPFRPRRFYLCIGPPPGTYRKRSMRVCHAASPFRPAERLTPPSPRSAPCRWAPSPRPA